MNLSIIQSIFKFKSQSKDNKYLKFKLNKNYQIIKLKGTNHLKRNTNLNELKISTHYMGEIDKNNFGITTSKLNLEVLKNLKKEKEIFKKFSNQEIYQKYYLNCFQSPKKNLRNSEKSYLKFDKIDIPKYKSSSDLSFENLKIPIIMNQKLSNSSLFDTMNNKKYLNSYSVKKEKIKKYLSSNNKYCYKTIDPINNNIDDVNNIYNSRNVNVFNSDSRCNYSNGNVKSILSKKPINEIYSYELKYRKIQSKNFFNDDSFSEESQNNVFNKNINFRKIFINSKKNSPISVTLKDKVY